MKMNYSACLDYSRDCERRANLCDSKVTVFDTLTIIILTFISCGSHASVLPENLQNLHSFISTCTLVCTTKEWTSREWSWALFTVHDHWDSCFSGTVLTLRCSWQLFKKERFAAPEQATVTKSRRPTKKCKDLAPDCEDTADLCDQSSFKKLMKKQWVFWGLERSQSTYGAD